MLKRIALSTVAVVIAVVVIAFGYLSFTRDDFNARAAAEIRAHPGGQLAQRTMLVTLVDGRMFPVNYLREAGVVFMGIDGRWWREFTGAGQPVEMFIQGEDYLGHATTVLDDPDYTADVFARLRPTAPKWLPRWLNGKLVVIDLED